MSCIIVIHSIVFILQIDTGKVQQKKGFFIEGGIHAREWISPATVMYMTGQVRMAAPGTVAWMYALSIFVRFLIILVHDKSFK